METDRYSDLCTNPRWQAEDLGKPLPESPHATSVALPLWKHVIGYEEGDPAVLDRLACGYPRFFLNPFVKGLFDQCAARFAREGEAAFAFPSRRIAHRCARFIALKTDRQARIEAVDDKGVHAVLFPVEVFATAKQYWQHFGEIVSSRQAQALLDGRTDSPQGAAARQTVRERIATHTGAFGDDVYLYPSGMAALTEALCMVQAQAPGARNVQLGFPYVDVLKIQTVWGPGTHFLPQVNAESVEQVAQLTSREALSGVITEFPGNPLLQSPDLPQLASIAHRAGVPLVVDDTPGTFANVDVLQYADVLVTSLTKAFSGVGDVLAGSMVLNRRSPFYESFRRYQVQQHEELLWGEDAVVLESNSRDFAERVRRVNETALRVCEHLRRHPAVERLYYPAYECREAFDAVRRDAGGYSGLFSLLLRDAEETAPAFYDALRVSKGPSLGANFTLACPYTLLAHYTELDWAASAGISPHLVRVSIGLEEADDLIARFEEALPGTWSATRSGWVSLPAPPGWASRFPRVRPSRRRSCAIL